MIRSNITKNCEPAMNGVARTTSSDVVKFAHTRSGMRQNVIPGARIVMIVTRELRAGMIDEAPAHWTPMVNKGEQSAWTYANTKYAAGAQPQDDHDRSGEASGE